MTDRFRQQPRQREYDDPDESNRPLPWVFGLFAAIMVTWGAWYIFGLGARGDAQLGDGRTLAALAAAPAGAADGAQLFTGKCAACHQGTGQGVAGVFPPLVASEWVVGSDTRLVQILLHGIQEEIIVKGDPYNGLMPAWKSLSDEELAAIATYVRTSWGNAASAVTVELVRTERERTAARTEPWKGGAELETVP
jgi:mono/diheme cytochrome c family protein